MVQCNYLFLSSEREYWQCFNSILYSIAFANWKIEFLIFICAAIGVSFEHNAPLLLLDYPQTSTSMRSIFEPRVASREHSIDAETQ